MLEDPAPKVASGELDTNVLYCDDNLVRLRLLPDDSVDLIYLDPPFFSNRFYEVIWGDEAEVRSFEDRWEGGVQLYVNWMQERLFEMHRILKSTGSLYLHCDPNASHYLKVALDELFGGREHFRSEIVWRRTGAHNKTRRYAPIHDTILFYTKSRDKQGYTWNYPKRPYMRGHVEQYFARDDRGWRTDYYGNVLTGSGRRGGESGKPWRGIDPTEKGRHWAIPKALLDEVDEDLSDLGQHEKLDRLYELGYITLKPGDAWPMYEHRITPGDGTYAPDIWAFQPYTNGTVFGTEAGIDEEVRWLSPRDQERLGYPTQKPEALLTRIIEASSDEGQVVLDAFCGCGTTVAVADRLKREWIGIDISPTAMGIIERRLIKAKRVPPKIIGMPTTEAELRDLKHFEFQNWVIQSMQGAHSPRKVKDRGVDGWTFFRRDPIQVKQSDKVGRPVVDIFETAIERSEKEAGVIVGFSFTKDAHEEVARVKAKTGVEIKLLTVRELLRARGHLQTPELGEMFPEPPKSFLDLPLPPSPRKSARPKADELIQLSRLARSRAKQ